MTQEKSRQLVSGAIPKPFESWIQDGDDWKPPVEYPGDENNFYTWIEQTQSWLRIGPPL